MLLALPIASRAKDVFYIQPFNIVPGDTKTISLNLDNANGYRGFQTDIVLPEGLSIVKQTNNSLAISPTSRASSFALSSNEIGDRTTRLLCYSAQYETISGNSGALVNIQVKASSDFAGGYVQLKNTIFSNENNQDVNMDGSQVSVQTKEQNFISVADDEVTAGKGKAFALQLTNETSLTACQFDVAVPSGLSLDLEKCSVTGRCSSSHQLTSKDLGNGRYRFVCMSMDNTTFVGHSGTILNLWVNAEASARDHKKVKVENVVFSDAKAQTYRFEPISFDVNVSFVVATSIRLSESSLSLQVDDSRTLTATVLPENCTDKSVVWESSNEQVATVDANGKVIAKAEGQCQIIAYSADRSVKAECAVTVTKIPLTVRVEDVSRKYGDENPQFKISYEGFRDGDTETRLTTSAVAQTDANLKSAVGDYEIILSGAESNKYSFNYVAGTLTITKAPLTISAGNYTKKQGDAMPAFKASYDGFKNGETESVLTKQPVFSTDANEASSPAEYAVNVSSAEAENYEISYQPGTLTVTEADAVIIRAKSYTRQYGDANPVFEYEVEGAALEGTPELTCSAVANSPVGAYTIELSKGSVKNYNVHFENGTMTITKAPLTISAGNYTKKQGDAMPELKASYGGFKNGENETVLTKQPVFSTEANESSSSADYVVNVSGAEAENYEITYQPGTLTVTEMPAPILSVVNKELQISTELADAIIYYTLDGTNPDENSKVYSAPISLYASCMIKAIVVKNGVKSKIAETEYHDAQYPDIVKVGDLITANIINNGEENLPMLFSVTSVYPFEVTLLNKEEYVEGWRNEQLIGDIEVPAFVTSNGVSFAVKSIGRRALCASGKVTSLKLNEGLEYIAQEALRTIGRIKELVIPNSVKEIGSANIIDDMNLNTMVLGKGVEILHFNAFWSTNVPLKEIYSLNPVPPVCGAPDITFEGMPDGVTLYVPIGSKEAYETAPGWNHFAGHIVEINPTAIKPVVISIKDNTSWYNLRGVRSLEKPTAPGIYIHGGKKVIIK